MKEPKSMIAERTDAVTGASGISAGTTTGLAGRDISRRQALRITAAAGISLAFGASVTRSLLQQAKLNRRSETRIQLGTPVTITVVHVDDAAARAMIAATFAEIERLESILSRHRPGTPVAQLARTGSLHDAPPELTMVLTRANDFSALTNGAFDVTIAPVLDLYRHRAAEGTGLPAPEEVEAARALVDYRSLHVQGGEVRLGQPGMALTLDGIAKGYVVDQAVKTLLRGGADRVLVGASGDIATTPSSDTDGWNVAIQDPRDPAASLGTLNLHGEGVATSGDYMQAFTQDRTLHHIIDPRTGRSPELTSAVTVTATSAMDADALSTAAFVLGAEQGIALLEGLEGVEGMIVTKDGRQYQTTGFRRTA